MSEEERERNRRTVAKRFRQKKYQILQFRIELPSTSVPVFNFEENTYQLVVKKLHQRLCFGE